MLNKNNLQNLQRLKIDIKYKRKNILLITTCETKLKNKKSQVCYLHNIDYNTFYASKSQFGSKYFKVMLTSGYSIENQCKHVFILLHVLLVFGRLRIFLVSRSRGNV